MNEHQDEKLRELLKTAVSPVDAELKRDLWPRMLARLDQQAARVPWFDWVLVALLAACFFFFPGIIPALLYHL